MHLLALDVGLFTKKLRHEASVLVLDRGDQPIQGAQVTLVSSSHPHSIENQRVTQMSDANGKAHFNALHELRLESMMIHREVFFWNIHINKDGYTPFKTNFRRARQFKPEMTMTLSKAPQGKPAQ